MQRVVHSYKELTPKELNEKKKISKAFSRQFWKKQNKLNTPHMQKEDYLQVFSTATEILARIRCAMHLNFTLTGNATNFLLQMAEVPKADNDFIRNIVHEALKDSKGYVAKLTKESVDKFIDEHLLFVQKRESKRINDRKEMVTKVKETWNEAINNMDVVFLKREQLQQSYSDLFLEDNSTHEPFIEDIAEKIVNLNDSLLRFKDFQHKRQLKLEKKAQNKKQKISSEKEASSSESTPTQEHKEVENNTNIENNEKTETPVITENKTETEGTSTTEETYTTNEEQQQEDPNQKEIDEKVMITVQKVGESVEVLQEKLNTLSKNTDLHHLQEINELPFNEKKEKIKYLRTNTLALAEKLSEHLFSLDQLVGSSEKVRPYKKKTVNQIQGILSQVDQVSEKLKHLESDLKVQEEKEREREERERLEQEEFDRKEREEFERILLEERSKREKERQEERERREREERERFLREKQEREKKEREMREKLRQQQMQSQFYPPVHPSYHQQQHHNHPIQKISPNSEREIVVNQRNEDNIKRVGNFPLPTREHWKKLKYEADFEIKKVSGKYHLQSFVPNLDLKELKILEKDNVLNISGTRYPTEKEEKQLIQKLLNWLKHYSSDISDWTENDFVRAILKVGSGSFGTFNVSYSLPDDYDPKQQITASYQRGVLEIEVPIIALQQKKFVHPFFANNFGGFDNFW